MPKMHILGAQWQQSRRNTDLEAGEPQAKPGSSASEREDFGDNLHKPQFSHL